MRSRRGARGRPGRGSGAMASEVPVFDDLFAFARGVETLAVDVRARLARVYHVEIHEGHAGVGASFTTRLEEMFAGVPRAAERVERQHLVRITNTRSLDTTWFNDVRAMYHRAKAGGPCERKTVVLKVAPDACDFCAAEAKTAHDLFLGDGGRLRDTHALTCSNVAKFGPVHSCVIFREHDPLAPARSVGALGSLLRLANEWAAATVGIRPDLHPVVGWNCLERAGASMEHAHAQLIALPDNAVWVQRLAGPSPSPAAAGDYVHTMLQSARDLGLAVDHHGACVFPSLAPVANAEMYVVADSGGRIADAEGGEAGGPRYLFGNHVHLGIHLALATVTDGVLGTSFNATIAVVPCSDAPSGAYAVARVIDRGDYEARYGAGYMEMLGNGVVGNMDPFELTRVIRETQRGIDGGGA